MILRSRKSNVAERGVIANRLEFNLERMCSNLVGDPVDNIGIFGAHFRILQI